MNLVPEWCKAPEDINNINPKLWPEEVQRNQSGELEIAGVSVSELAQEYGTPLFVMSETDFRNRAIRTHDVFNKAFDGISPVDVYYAGKAFLCSQIIRWLRKDGLRLDTCSNGEMALAAAAGMPGELLGLHGNNKSDSELKRALSLGVGRIVVDCLDEIPRLAQLAHDMDVQAPVMIRVKPGVHASTHEYIATAHEDQKFGLSIADGEALQAIQAVVQAQNLNFLGLHCHIGSQIFEADGFAAAATRMLQLVSELKQEHDIEVKELDLGGGYGIAYTDADEPRDIEEVAQTLAQAVSKALKKYDISQCPRLSIEPGRSIVGPSMFTLYSIGSIKQVSLEEGTRSYVAVDGGMSDNPRPVLYDADYTAVLASRTSEAQPMVSRVVGKHCESGDIVVRNGYLPQDTTRDDLLAVPATGAYCWALASNFNYVERPAIVAVKDGKTKVIVKGETEEDLLARDAGL
ncbi:MAG: diaminopimelate decarboxylase [Micrococcaceae bacterium]